mgnify:CR=1 FL=1
MVQTCFEVAHATGRPIDEVMNYTMTQLEGWLEFFRNRADTDGD